VAFDEHRLRTVVVQTLRIPEQRYRPDLQLGDLDEWDSVAHLELVAAIEQAFGMQLSADEIVELTSLDKIRARLSGRQET
jgi:acyl carrier protein